MGWVKWIAVGAIVVAAAGVVVLLLDDSETEQFGDATVEIETTPGATDAENVRDVILQIQEQAGATDEVLACTETQLAAVPDAELDELVDLAQGGITEEVQTRLALWGTRLVRPCIRGETVDEDLTENEIEIQREGALRQIDAWANRFQLPEEAAECLRGKIESLSDEELIEASNETLQENRARWVQWGRECRS
jgi:hypothetical protein